MVRVDRGNPDSSPLRGAPRRSGRTIPATRPGSSRPVRPLLRRHRNDPTAAQQLHPPRPEHPSHEDRPCASSDNRSSAASSTNAGEPPEPTTSSAEYRNPTGRARLSAGRLWLLGNRRRATPSARHRAAHRLRHPVPPIGCRGTGRQSRRGDRPAPPVLATRSLICTGSGSPNAAGPGLHQVITLGALDRASL